MELSSLPHNKEAESATLGSLLINPDAYLEIADVLVADDFYVVRNRYVFAAIQSLVKDKKPVDMLTVTDEIEKQGHLSEVGGAAYLTKLLENVPSSYHVKTYAEKVKDASIRRGLQNALTVASRGIFDEGISATQAVENAQLALDMAKTSLPTDNVLHVSTVIREYDKEIQSGELLGVYPFEWSELNRMFSGGLWQGLAYLMAGKRKSRKSILVQDMITQIASQGNGCLFISQEMNYRDYSVRAISSEGRVPEFKMRKGNIDGYWDGYNAAIEKMEKLPIWISQKPRWSIEGLRSLVHKMVDENDIKVVFVDYLGLLDSVPGIEKEEHKQLSAKADEMKRLAKLENVAIFAIHTINNDGSMKGGTNTQYPVDMGLQLMSDADFRGSDNMAGTDGSDLDYAPQENRLWLVQLFTRYGAHKIPVAIMGDPNFPRVEQDVVFKLETVAERERKDLQ